VRAAAENRAVPGAASGTGAWNGESLRTTGQPLSHRCPPGPARRDLSSLGAGH